MKKILQNTIFQSVIISGLFFILYLSTTPTTNVSYADSDLMITIGHFGGVAHPPGYPLYMLLLYWITNLAIPGTVAFRAHLLSAILHSVTLGVIYATISTLINYFIDKQAVNSSNRHHKLTVPFIATLSTASLGLSYLFWLYSSVAEKYPLNDLFAAIIYLLVLKITIDKSKTKLWLLLSLIFSLSLAHHHSILMLAPSLVLLAWQNKKSFINTLKFTLPLALIVYGFSILLLLWLNSHNSPVSWHFEPTVSGLYKHLTRREFTGYNIVQGEYRGIYLDPVTPSEIINKIPIYIDLLLKHFGVVTFALVIIGLIGIKKIDKKLSNLFTLFFVTTTLFIPMYVDWPDNLSVQSLRIRMYLLGYIVIPIFVSVALYKVINHLFQNKKTSQIINLTVITIISILILSRGLTLYPQEDLKKTTYIHDLYKNILTEAPENSLVACISDVSCFALLYSSHVENIRSDVTILPHGTHLVDHSLTNKAELKGFDYPENPEKFIDYLTWNLGKRHVFIVELQEVYSKLLGLNYGFLYYTPHGYYGELTKQKPSEVPNYNSKFSEQIANLEPAPLDHSRQQFRAQLAQKHLLNTITYARLGLNTSLLERELELARFLSVGLPDIYSQEVSKVDRLLSSPQTYDLYVPGSANPTDSQIVTQSQFYLDQQQIPTALIGINSLIYKDPKNPVTRFYLAKFFQSIHERQKALFEVNNILKYNPNYQPALTLRDQIITDLKY